MSRKCPINPEHYWILTGKIYEEKGDKMADIQIESRCATCGKEIASGERVICVSEATLTDRSTYGARRIAPGKMRVNFSGRRKAVYHTECYKW